MGKSSKQKRRMHRTDPPERPRRAAPTKQINIRMDVDLLRELEEFGPSQRRSVSNMIIKAVADYVDRLKDERRIREAIRNNQLLLTGMSSRELQRLIERQHMLLGRLPTVQGPLDPIERKTKPRTRRRPE